MADIRISRTAAIALVRMAADLFRMGTGFPVDPDERDAQDPNSVLDNIDPTDHDTMYWANEILRFARVVHGIIQAALITQDQNDTD